MNKTVLLIGALAAIAHPAAAEDQQEGILGGNLSANVAITSDYTFRGITQSSGDAAIQGGIDWANDLFYLGAWGSTVDFNDDLVDPFTGESISDGASTEIDLYVGFTPTIGELPVSFGFIYYYYPGAPQDNDDIFIPQGTGPFLVDPAVVAPGLAPGDVFLDFPQQDYLELNAGTSYTIGPIDLGLTFSWSPNYYFEAGDSLHSLLSASTTLSEFEAFGSDASLSFSGSVGYLEFFDEAAAAGTGFFEDYVEYGVGLTLSVYGIDFDGRWIDTSGLAGNGSTGVFTISKSF